MSERVELDDLRAVFVDELAEQVESLERQLLVLERGAAEAATREAVAEIYRIVHSLKGAARAVGEHLLERTLHDAEGALFPARSAPPNDAAALAGDVGRAIAATLRALLTRAAGETAPRSIPGGHARERERERSDALPDADSDPPSVVSTRERARPDEAAATTVRVASQRLAELLDAAERALATVARNAERTDTSATHEVLTALARDLTRLRATLSDSRSVNLHEVRRAVNASAHAAQTLVLALSEQREQTFRRWQEAKVATGAIVERSRALRLVRFDTLAAVLERAALDAARSVGRPIEFILEGGEIEADRRVIEGIRDPLLHVVRNAVDHGIESPEARARAGKPPKGSIRITAKGNAGEFCVFVRDDGRGFDIDAIAAKARAAGHELDEDVRRDALRLAFEPGLSTRAETTALSGRGIGLDVVRKRVAELQGRIEVESETGVGATLTLRLPVDLSLLDALVAHVRDVRVAFALSSVSRLLRVRAEEVHTIGGRTYVVADGERVPFVDLAVVLDLDRTRPTRPDGSPVPTVLLAAAERRVAVGVDQLVGDRQLTVRPLPPRVRRAPFVAGCSVLADADVALVLDASEVARMAKPGALSVEPRAETRKRILVADDSITTRQLERAILESAGHEVVAVSDGERAWEALLSGAFDLVVSDVEMPRLDGLGLLARVRAHPSTAKLPVVLVTARSDEDDRRRALELGASAYIVKSRFDQEELIDTVTTLL